MAGDIFRLLLYIDHDIPLVSSHLTFFAIVGYCSTETVIRTVLKSRLYEVQTYRMCLGILNFTKKYSNKALEECCKQASALNKQKYTFIKNTISVVADDLGEAGYRPSSPSKKELVRSGYVMSPEASSIDTLLTRSKALAD